MDKTILYPELVDYIFDYCTEFMSKKESQARWHHFAMQKSGNGKSEKFYTYFKNQGLINNDPEVIALLKNGFQTFKENIAARIYASYNNELQLNLCPRCFKIARTPLAKQCRFCFHDWH